MKDNKKNIVIFMTIFILLTVISIIQTIDNDQIWAYGFSYNIAKGLIPYKDFNMIIGPLYSLLFSIPIKIFGNYIIAYKIFHALIYSLILTFTYEKIGYKVIWIIIACAIQSTFCWYNIFCAMLTIAILLLLDSKIKYRDIYIGLLIGFIIMTKHNIGCLLYLVYFFTTKDKKVTLSVLIPIVISLIYLICTNSLLQYFDLCILGIGNFIENLRIEIPCLILTIVILIHYIKEYIKKRDIKILYIIAFMTVLFPLIERNHFLIAIVPMVYYVVKEEYKTITYKVMILFNIFGLISTLFLLPRTELIIEKNPYMFTLLDKGVITTIKNYINYTDKIEGNVYSFKTDAYNYKIYNNKTTSFYDLINRGNLGKNPEKYLEKLDKKCQKEKCSFIVDAVFFEEKKLEGIQLMDSYKEYVVENYDYIETLPTGDKLYSNRNKIIK